MTLPRSGVAAGGGAGRGAGGAACDSGARVLRLVEPEREASSAREPSRLSEVVGRLSESFVAASALRLARAASSLEGSPLSETTAGTDGAFDAAGGT